MTGSSSAIRATEGTSSLPNREALPDDRRRPCHTQHVRELLGLPQSWQTMIWRLQGQHPDYWGVTLEGGIAPPKTRGKYKGQPSWKLATMLRTYTLTNDQHEAWLARWEAEEGKCRDCEGTGQEWGGWSSTDGDRYRPCIRCDATGKPKATVSEISRATAPAELGNSGTPTNTSTHTGDQPL